MREINTRRHPGAQQTSGMKLTAGCFITCLTTAWGTIAVFGKGKPCVFPSPHPGLL
ncbi:hypothetical protein DAQ1742_00868 [Dickeya aquatica]|uniref:Uncharacterized protein n=1 Tax=Dickeya aquatica TaxID=1401087 RepID=A0A375A733_9GAMM|nr:hypothetical protein DAQ1742_00868 [Dickeya aquatica]